MPTTPTTLVSRHPLFVFFVLAYASTLSPQAKQVP
jgi:hypothetical protein